MDRNELQALQAALRGALATAACSGADRRAAQCGARPGCGHQRRRTRGARARHSRARGVRAGAAWPGRDDANTSHVTSCAAILRTRRRRHPPRVCAAAAPCDRSICRRLLPQTRDCSIAHRGNRVIESPFVPEQETRPVAVRISSRAGARSSAGRALRSQCRGREFDPPRVHHPPLHMDRSARTFVADASPHYTVRHGQSRSFVEAPPVRRQPALQRMRSRIRPVGRLGLAATAAPGR